MNELNSLNLNDCKETDKQIFDCFTNTWNTFKFKTNKYFLKTFYHTHFQLDFFVTLFCYTFSV